MVSVSQSNSTTDWKDVLRPFVHQVTGRCHMLSLNRNTVCKSLLTRELLFYTNICGELLPFVPKLKGVLYAQLVRASSTEGNYAFKAKQVFLKSQIENEVLKDIEDDGNNFQSNSQDSFGSVLFKGLERFKYDLSDGFTSHPWTVDKDTEALIEYIGANPWSVRQHRREINRMLSRDEDRWRGRSVGIAVDAEGNYLDDQGLKGLRGYLMLEDVTEGFQHPNVIDFKLGRQIERDDRTEEKKTKHAELVKNSSTGTLMLRLAGMQVYQVNSDHYLCRDKYYGRGLSTSGFEETIRQFLNNGERLLTEVIEPIVEKLQELRTILKKKDTYRFYASSLLILYEGGHCPGLESRKEESGCRPFKRKIEVKMIDFAHSTYKGFNGEQNYHQGPDLDCCNAISNLIHILNDIAKQW